MDKRYQAAHFKGAIPFQGTDEVLLVFADSSGDDFLVHMPVAIAAQVRSGIEASLRLSQTLAQAHQTEPPAEPMSRAPTPLRDRLRSISQALQRTTRGSV